MTPPPQLLIFRLPSYIVRVMKIFSSMVGGENFVSRKTGLKFFGRPHRICLGPQLGHK